MTKLETMLKDWNDSLGARTMSDAEDLINQLQIEIAGKKEVIKSLKYESV